MKKQTAEDKLNALFGLTEKAATAKTQSTGRVVGVTEEEIQEFREIQGLIYFLQAPALFTPKKCAHCGERFLVSRKYVAYCSYTCIRESFKLIGIKWSKGRDLEALANDPNVYDGNEPIWIRYKNLTSLKEALTTLLTALESEDSPIQLSPNGGLELGHSLSPAGGTTSQTKSAGRSSSARTTTSSTTKMEELFPGITTKPQSTTTASTSRRKNTKKRKFT